MRDNARPRILVAREEDKDSDSDGEFEFPSVSRGTGDDAPADELFAGGRIRAFYPVFGRVLLDEAAPAGRDRDEPARAPLGRLFQLEKARTTSVASFQLDKARTSSVASTSSSSSSYASSSTTVVDLDVASPDSYCLWTPGASSSPSRPPTPRKSGSTGSLARWRRIGDLVVGMGRSRSDGGERFMFLSAPPSPARVDRGASSPATSPGRPAKNSKRSVKKGSEIDQRMSSYTKGKSGGGSPGGARRTFLPYRQNLVGLFANAHGLRRRSS